MNGGSGEFDWSADYRFENYIACDQGKGLGYFLLTKAFSIIIDMATLGGIKCITVLAKDDNSAKFYERFGFVHLQNINQLVLPVETLIKAGF